MKLSYMVCLASIFPGIIDDLELQLKKMMVKRKIMTFIKEMQIWYPVLYLVKMMTSFPIVLGEFLLTGSLVNGRSTPRQILPVYVSY